MVVSSADCEAATYAFQMQDNFQMQCALPSGHARDKHYVRPLMEVADTVDVIRLLKP